MELKNKIKFLKERKWDDDLIIQQLCVDYEIDNLDDMIKDIKIQVRKVDPIKALAMAGIMVGLGSLIMKGLKI
jgi:hypothetical protein